MSSFQSSAVTGLYLSVINDTINRSRKLFAEEGIDEQTLINLRQSWESKLMYGKTVDLSYVGEQNKNQYSPITVNNSAHQLKIVQHQEPQNHHQQHQNFHHQHQHSLQPQQQQQMITVVLPSDHANKYFPIPSSSQESGSKILSTQAPSSTIQGNMPSDIISNQVIPNCMEMATPLDAYFLQQHSSSVHGAQSISSVQTFHPFLPHQQQLLKQNNQTLISGDVTDDVKKTIAQIDGLNDSSTSDDDYDYDMNLITYCDISDNGDCKNDDDDDGDEDDDDDGDVDDDDDGDEDDDDGNDDDGDDDDNDDGVDDYNDDDNDKDDYKDQNNTNDDEELNSGDDESDIWDDDLFNSENIIVCQFLKITHIKNCWKLRFKDGIMSLNGNTYVFGNAAGNAVW